MDDTPWTIEKSAELYQLDGWGAPYFTINAKGNISVRPDPSRDTHIDMYELVESLRQARGIELPLLIRFPDILRDRIGEINGCFARAIQEYGYRGAYRGVYPIKVNQNSQIVDDVVEMGSSWRYGLEAGSKPELLIAISALQERDGFIICNGYKDREYLETALIAQKFDNTVVVVLERMSELGAMLETAARLDIRPCLGVRAKLSSKGMGRWATSSGDRAKFGLTAAEVLEVVDTLKEAGMLDCLQLLHFHIGSQVSSIIPVKNAIREASHLYVELAQLGANMRFLDVGGGLAVDYDGSRTDFHASRNYDIQEYAYDIVGEIQSACDKASLSPPTIVTEAGRATVAHQSVLLFEVLEADDVFFGDPTPVTKDEHRVIEELYTTYQGIAPKNVQEAWHDALQARDEARSLFRFGYLGLRELARAEKLFWHCCERIQNQLARRRNVPEELQPLEEFMSAIYYCNFSLFQSAPDTWAIDQLFPMMPIHRLTERPTIKARLADLTCDSDGIIDNFIDKEEERSVLDVHPIEKGQPYVVGMFLGGAYQEILGDLHNLFGDTNSAHIRVDDDGYDVTHVFKGDTVEQVLRYVLYNPSEMIERVRRKAERALRERRMTSEQMRTFVRHFEEGLRGYTYLKGADSGA